MRTVYDHELDSDGDEIGDFYTRNKEIKNVGSWSDLQHSLSSSRQDIWIVEYYLPWCEPCQTFSSQFKKLPSAVEAAGIRQRVRLAAVNCDTQEETCQRMGIRSYPAVQMYPPNQMQAEMYRDGELTASKVLSALKDLLVTFLRTISLTLRYILTQFSTRSSSLRCSTSVERC